MLVARLRERLADEVIVGAERFCNGVLEQVG